MVGGGGIGTEGKQILKITSVACFKTQCQYSLEGTEEIHGNITY